MKRIWLALFSCLCTVIHAATPSYNYLGNFYDEFLSEQKAYLANNRLTAPPPTGYLPFTIVNNSTFPDTQVYVLILANTLSNIITFSANSAGQMVGTSVSPPVRTYVSQMGSGTYPLSFFPSSAANTYTFYLPTTVNLTSCRIFYSIGEPLDWFIATSGAIQVPQQDFANPQQDNYYTLYDKQEFTMVANDRFAMNPTLVDYYGIPLSFSISYTNYSVNPAVPAIAYAGLPPSLASTTIFQNYATAASGLTTGTAAVWESLNLSYTAPHTGATAQNLRVLSPSQAIQTTVPVPLSSSPVPLFPVDYFLDTNSLTTCHWLTEVWKNMANNAPYQAPNHLYIDLSTAGPTYGVASGQVDNSGNFVFTAGAGTGAGSTLTLPLPTSSKAFFTSTLTDYTPAISQTGDPNVATAVWQGLSAGVMSGIVPLSTPSSSSPLSQSFIRQQTLFTNNAGLTCNGPWYDFYSGTFIGMGSGNYTKFYTTPYGDYLGTDGTITVTNIANAGASVTVNIGSMENITVLNPFDDDHLYTVVFPPLPAGAGGITVTFGTNPDFSANPQVPSGGDTYTMVAGSTMYMGITYNSGSCSGKIWGTHIIPSGPAIKPALPNSVPMTLVGGPGGTLTISPFASPP